MITASSPVISSNIFHKTITLSLHYLWGPLMCSDPDPLCSMALLFCSPAQPRSNSVTALCLRPKVLVQPSHFQAVSAETEEAEGSRVWNSWLTATSQGPSPDASSLLVTTQTDFPGLPCCSENPHRSWNSFYYF